MPATKQNGFTNADKSVSYVNYGEDDQMEVHGYVESGIRNTLTWCGIVLTAGLLRLVFHWFPQWLLYATHTKCPLKSATTLLVLDNYQGKHRTYFVKRINTISTHVISPTDMRSVSVGASANQLSTMPQSVCIQLNNGTTKDVNQVRTVRIKKLTCVWDEDRAEFVKLAGLDKGLCKAELYQYTGYNEYQQQLRRIVYGSNEIPVKVQGILALVLLEIINPFYIFQVFSLSVWLSDGYYYYPIAIVLMTAFGIATTVRQTRMNQLSLQRTVQSTDKVTVWRGKDQYEDIPTTNLVPGDVIVIPAHGCDMHCDAVLLSGTCIVNESMLTGESVPVNKTALPRQTAVYYHSKEDANHTLFCGTKVIQTRYYGKEQVKAVVLRTGFLTAKGSLVRSIMYPPPADFRFDQDSYKFIGILSIIAALGIIYTVVIKVGKEIAAGNIAIKALDLITIVIPPALPAAMAMGKMYAQTRLQKRGIFCINSRVINVAGGINCVCFDKTGTLTEDGLDMWGVVPVKNRNFKMPVRDVSELTHHPLQQAMASCHSLTLIDNNLIGDPLDIKMFESTGWTLEEPEIADQAKYDLMVPTVVKSSNHKEMPIEIGLVHQFQFSSTLQRMSVVTRTLGSQDLQVYCKGSPEMIVSLSNPDSVPADFATSLQQYTEQGYRVIAMGRRTLVDISYTRLQRMQREEVEQDLEFLGLIVLENRMKPETKGIIQLLKEAEFKNVMITGDNILTAVSVARDCGIISPGDTVVNVTAVPGVKDGPSDLYFNTAAHTTLPVQNGLSLWDVEAGIGHDRYKLVLTGTTWATIRNEFPHLVPRVCVKGVVFARMSSEQKQQVIQELQALGYCVAMCGDGANDCGALKAAHVGISLSEAECSVASPFTSREPNISCVPLVVSEGRAALSTSSGVFRFMVAYSLTEFFSCIILYAIESNLTDLQFLFIDIALIVNFAFFFGRTQAYTGPLVPEPPLNTLLSFIPLASMTLHVTLIAAVQLAVFYMVRMFPWYPDYDKKEDSFTCYENYAVYTVSLFQYIASAIVFSQGKPYRQQIYTNVPLLTSLIVMTLVCTYQAMYPASWLLTSFEYILPPNFDFPVIVLCMGIINLIVGLILENVIVNFLLVKAVKLTRLEDTRKKYLAVEKEVMMERWPEISELSAELRESNTHSREPAKTVNIELRNFGAGNQP